MDNKDKKSFYESATRNILAQIGTMGLSDFKEKQAIYYVKLFRELFKYDEIKRWTFLTPENHIWDFGYDSAGFCYASSITFAIAMGFNDWQLMYIDGDKWAGGLPHYWLQHKSSKTFFDITYDQFAVDGFTVPYEIGESVAFALAPGDAAFKFADAAGVDIIKTLKGANKRK